MRAILAASLIGAICVAAGCSREPAVRDGSGGMAPIGELSLRVRDRRMLGPDSIVEGWTRMRVEEDGEGHIIVVLRLSPALDPKHLAAFFAAYDSLVDIPANAVPIGGAEAGDASEVILDLTPGHYLIVCPVRDDARHRHGAVGESRLISVVGRTDGTRQGPPTAMIELLTTDFAYTGSERWPAGPQNIRVVNNGQKNHQLRLARLLDGVTLRQWLEAEDSETAAPVDSMVAGMARLGPGMTAYVPVTLTPGKYVAYCLIHDVASDKPHVMLGMFREIIVE